MISFTEAWLEYVWAMLWQSTIVMLAVWFLYALAWKRSAAFRYALLCLILLKFLLPTSLHSVTGLGHWFGSVERYQPAQLFPTSNSVVAPEFNRERPDTALPSLTSLNSPSESQPVVGAERSVHLHSLLFSVWLAGILFLASLLLVHAVRIRRRFSSAVRVDEPEILSLLADCQRKMGVSLRTKHQKDRATGVETSVSFCSAPREEAKASTPADARFHRVSVESNIPLFQLDGLSSPVLAGLIRPRILVSPETLHRLNQTHLHPIFLHELAHARRRDLWVNTLQILLQVLWFFHPGLWFTNWLIRRERERACDDLVLAKMEGAGRDYADSILRVLKENASPRFATVGLLGIAERGASVKGRIRRILDTNRRIKVRIGVISFIALFVSGIVLLPLASVESKLVDPTSNKGREAAGESLESCRIDCVDKNGNPITGAEVYLVQMSADSFPVDPEDLKVSTFGPVQTDATGIAQFEVVPLAGGYFQRSVYARAPGKSVGVGMQARIPGTTDIYGSSQIVMVASKDLRGHVSLPAGCNPANTRVRVLGVRTEDGRSPHGAVFDRHSEWTENLWPELFETTPDSQGDFTIENAPVEGMIYLAAEGPGLGQAQFHTADVAGTQLVSMTMLPESAIEGTLLFEPSGEPATGMTVVASPDPRGGNIGVILPFETEVKVDGTFRIDGLPESFFTVTVPVGTQPSEWNVAVQSVRTKTGETTSGIDLRMEKGALVTGTVLDADSGAPIAGVHVTALNPGEDGGSGIGNSISDEGGKYALRLPKGSSMLYLSSIPTEKYNYPQGEGNKVIEVVDGQETIENVDFNLEPRTAPQWKYELAKATGRVQDHENNPIAEAGITDSRVYFMDGAERMEGSKVGVTDEDGRFEVGILANATHELIVGGGRFTVARSPKFYLESESTHNVGDLQVLPATSSISGVVVSPEGVPIPRVQVYAGSEHRGGYGLYPDVFTDEKGAFQVDGVYWQDDDLTVEAHKVGYQLRNLNGVLPGSRDVRVVLFPDDDPLRPQIGKEIPNARDLVGREAPQWDVETWVQAPEDASLGPKRQDGRRTALLYATQYAEWPQVFSDLKEFESICSRKNCVPVVIFSCATDPSVPKRAIEQHGLTLSVAFDRFDPYSEYSHPAATFARYGGSHECGNPPVFVIDSNGIVKHVQVGLDGLEEALANPDPAGPN